MSLNPARLSLGRAGWITFAITEVTLFLAANLTAKNSSHPGAVSNAFFITFIVGLAAALLLAAATLIRRKTRS